MKSTDLRYNVYVYCISGSVHNYVLSKFDLNTLLEDISERATSIYLNESIYIEEDCFLTRNIETVKAKRVEATIFDDLLENDSEEELIEEFKKGYVEEDIPTKGRTHPQLSCTISSEDKKTLDELALYIAGRDKRMVNTSIIVRALIRFGNKYKDKLVF